MFGEQVFGLELYIINSYVKFGGARAPQGRQRHISAGKAEMLDKYLRVCYTVFTRRKK